jgi:hypothetical protein
MGRFFASAEGEPPGLGTAATEEVGFGATEVVEVETGAAPP